MVVSELRGEKIDIIPYNEEPARFVAKALSPARVREVLVDDEKQEATVIVPDDQLSLAIGREGQNARLAAKLTGWKVDIKSETEFSQEEEDLSYDDGQDLDGRCAAVLSAGRRCPNASLQGSRYCGLPQHQALARFDTNQVTVLSALSEDEISKLADQSAGESEVRPLVERATAEFERSQGEQAPRGESEEERPPSEPDEAAKERERAEESLEEAQRGAEADVREAEQEMTETEERATEHRESVDPSAVPQTGEGGAEEAEDAGEETPREEALAEDTAVEAEEHSAETAPVGAEPSEESEASAEDSEA